MNGQSNFTVRLEKCRARFEEPSQEEMGMHRFVVVEREVCR